MNREKRDFLWFLYHTKIGRVLLKIVSNRLISKVLGFFLNTKFSIPFIKPFIKKNNIDLSEYENKKYQSFNDFFTRKIKKQARPIDCNKNHFISPCDGYLSAYQIQEGLVLPIKESQYSIESLLKDPNLANIYKDGTCLVFRLCVNHYHRYCSIDNGIIVKNMYIKGVLHTVRPVALEEVPVFIENSREYTVINTENFGLITQIEVGALLVGKIKNYKKEGNLIKGEEKGMFLFGGSTIILLLKKEEVTINETFFVNTETPVKMGEKIGVKNQ